MSYERLNLQDFIDVLTAAKVSHIEDGIVNNENQLTTMSTQVSKNTKDITTNKTNINSCQTQLSSLWSTVNPLETSVYDLQASELCNSILPLWHTLLSNGGEKIFPPLFSFDGTLTGKTILPLETTGEEVCACYVRLGDAPGRPYVSVMTYGGLYHLLAVIGEDVFGFGAPTVSTGQQFLSGSMVIGTQSYNTAITYDTEVHTTIKPLISEMCPSLELPPAFSIDHDFEYNNQIYPSGFYGICIYLNYLKISSGSSESASMMPDLPLFYVDRFWPLLNIENVADVYSTQLNAALDYSKASNAFECAGESIFWNGSDRVKSDIITPSDNPLSWVKCISHNPQAFLQACMNATSIEYIEHNGTTELLNIEAMYENNRMAYALGDKIVIFTMPYPEADTFILPGVYVGFSNVPFELKFHGIDTEKLFNPYKIDNQYLPAVPEFNLTEMGMSPVQVNGEYSILNMDTTKLYLCSRKGPVRLIIPTALGGEVSCLATFAEYNNANQSVLSVYYNIDNVYMKIDILIVFDNDRIMVKAIPLA